MSEAAHGPGALHPFAFPAHYDHHPERLAMTSPKSTPSPGVSDRHIQALLERHRCPTPLHVLRTLIMGAIASPRLDVSAMAPLRQAWGGELPEFASEEEAQELIQVIVNGLWNRLADHQSTRNPFRLQRLEVLPKRSALLDLARMRARELQGFVNGLFGPEDEVLLPPKAHNAVQTLAEAYALFGSVATLLADESKPAAEAELKALLRQLQQLTLTADEQINKAVQSCKRARGQHLQEVASVMTRKTIAGLAQAQGEDTAVADRDGDDDPRVPASPLSQTLTRNGVTVRVEIYGDFEGRWILEIVDAQNNSHVWDEHFETEQQALDEALRALDEEPLAFLDRSAGEPLN